MPKLKPRLLPLLLFGFALPLLAQPQVLPSVEIRSGTPIKAPLIKKPVVFPLEVPADSIPPRIPPVFSGRHEFAPPPSGNIRPLKLDFSTGTTAETKLTTSWYSASGSLPLLRLDADLRVPAAGISRSALSGSVQSIFSENLSLNHLLSWQQSKFRSFSAGALSYSVSHRQSELELAGFRLSALQTGLSLEGLEQDLAGTRSSDFALGIRHSHLLSWRELDLKNRLVLQDTALGLAAQYRVPWLGKRLPELDLGLMTDFIHVLPALDLHKRFPLGNGRYLELNNRTELASRSFQSLRELYPWSVLPQRERLVMTPLNLSLGGWQSFGAEASPLRLAGLRQNLSYSYNQPQLYVRDVSGQTWLRQEDVFSCRLGGDLRLHYLGWEIAQDLSLNLEYLPDDRWRRRPFSPLLSAVTTASRKLGELDILATLDQRYWQRDEFEAQLPPVFDLSLELRYPLRPGLALTASLANIFHTPHQDFGDIPQRGRSFMIAFRYLPLR
ncbi:MAG: hypothetical protein LHW57_08240 [Candidatus Cloacimonetes bacterium]|nr:hypothetical protein [Candidatus Cloacimonadota bacterium]